jgi:hypothetical protein
VEGRLSIVSEHAALGLGLALTDLGHRELVVDEEYAHRHLRSLGVADVAARASTRCGMIAPPAVIHYEPHLGWPESPEFVGAQRALNNSVDWQYFRSIAVGDVLVLANRLVDRYVRRNRDHIVYEMTAATTSGDLVAVARRVSSHAAEPAMTPEAIPVREAEPSGYGGDVAPNIPIGKMVFDEEALSFHESPSELNYHNSKEVAVAAGFEDILVAGAHQFAAVSMAIHTYFAPRWNSGVQRLRIKFLQPVYINQQLELTAAAPRVSPLSARMSVDIAGEVNGALCCIATFTIG